MTATVDAPAATLPLRAVGLHVAREGRPVLRDVSLDLGPGECLALVGPNGGGKTTLLRTILGWLPSSAGTIDIAGLTPEAARRRGNVIGYVPQRPAVPNALPMTARQVVRLAAPRGRAGRAWADALVERALGTSQTTDWPVTRLSGGQLQQVFLARALANRPHLLLLDEPTVGLDRMATNRLIDLLALARDELGTGILLATHDHLVALRILRQSDELIYLDQTIRYRGPADAVPPHLDARLCHHE